VTVPATYQTTDPLHVSFDASLQLGYSEPLAVGVKRVALEQFELGAGGFFDGEDLFAEAIHEARRTVKRVRSLLRLVRGELTDRIYRYEDTALRDTGKMLASPRSSVSVVSAAGVIKDLYGEFLVDETFDEMITRLARRRDVIQLQTMEDPALVVKVVRTLEKAHGRYSTWPTDPDARQVYGMGIRDEYAAIAPGLNATYAGGRGEMVTAYSKPTDQNFHQWRKKVKYLRHQMEFLAPLWPEVIVGTAVTLDRLGFLLGEDHDLAELTALLRGRPELCPNPRERSLFFALATQRRAELRVAAEILGRRVYAEKPGSFQGRFGEYWGSRRLALDTSFDTLVVY
jgi:CHAD domain-containing protein